jgi:hypothetical protein
MINDMNISTDMGAIEPMDDTELQGIVSAELEDAVSYIDSDVSPIRAKGTEYYRGDPFGNEEDGRSSSGGDGGARHCQRHAAKPDESLLQL